MKTMRTIFTIIMAFTLLSTGCAQPSDKKVTSEDAAAISVCYFHFNARCATCRAIESEAKTAVDDLRNDDIGFAAFNLDEKAGKTKGDELGVSGQTLLILKGDRRIDLTREGFLYARTNPDKFRQILDEKIKSLL